MYFSGFALEKWWNPKFKTKFFLEVERVKIFLFLFYLKWERIIKDTGTAAGHGLILRRVSGRTVSTGWHCVCVLLNVLYVKAFYFHVCKLNNVCCICSCPRNSVLYISFPQGLSWPQRWIVDIPYALSCPRVLDICFSFFLSWACCSCHVEALNNYTFCSLILYAKLSALHVLSYSDPLR